MALPTDARPRHAPPLARHRLVGGDGMAALLDDDAVVDWWCHPGLDDPPQLWSLLDADGGIARWWNAAGVRQVGLAAGPCARTTVNIDGEVVSCWDGLIRVHGSPTLVRLIRSTTRPLGVTHELRAGGFGATPPTLAAATTGDPPHRVGASLFCSLTAHPDRWGAVVVCTPDRAGQAPDVPELISSMALAERRAQDLVRSSSIVTAHRERVETALLVLDACTDPASGAVVAAPTTSVPEVPGADRQFDYRYAWIRDASLAAAVAAAVGRPDVAHAHVDWVVERCLACEGVPVPVTRTSGEPVPDEQCVDGIDGWAGSRPVRVGNAARHQLQVDGAGMVAEALWSLVRTGGGVRHDGYRALAGLADAVAERPREPTGGIWELRAPIDGTSADVGRWLLFDRAVRLSRVHQPWARRRREGWLHERDVARDRVLGARLLSGAIPLEYGGIEPDGAGLLPVVLGLLPTHHPAAVEVVDGTLRDLGVGAPVRAVRRYNPSVDDGFHGDVGAFVPVSWMAVSALAQLDRTDEAHALADRLCASLPGLQPEILGEGDEALGNLPLVWAHAEAIRALYLLRVADLRKRYGRLAAGAWQLGRGVQLQLRSAQTRRKRRGQSRGRTERAQ